MTLDKSLTEITEADLQYYVDNEVAENLCIEYKQQLPGEDYDSRKEFLSDVSAFANAVGGHIIFGIREEDRVPVEVCGLG